MFGMAQKVAKQWIHQKNYNFFIFQNSFKYTIYTFLETSEERKNWDS